MPLRKRRRIEPTKDWPQLQLQFTWPEQVTYELIRPVVRFGFSPAERAQQTGVPARTIYRKADRFDAQGSGTLWTWEQQEPPWWAIASACHDIAFRGCSNALAHAEWLGDDSPRSTQYRSDRSSGTRSRRLKPVRYPPA